MHIATHLDIELVAIDQADEVTCLLQITAPQSADSRKRPGRTLVLVLDRSGSMAGTPLTAAKDSIARLVRQLAPHDCFGLVTFDDQAQVIVPPMLMADHEMASVQRAILAIEPGGMTDLSAGYLLALRETKRSLKATAHAGATMLIVSDGHANGGITDPDRLKQVAVKALSDGITTSTLGLGLGYDEDLLDRITRGGNGSHCFAPDVDTAVRQLQQTVTDLLDVSVLAATVRIAPNSGAVDGVRLRQDLSVWHEPGALVVNVGDLYAGEERRMLIAFDVPALPDLGTCTIAEISIDFTVVDDLAEHHVWLPITVNVVPGDQARGRVPNPVVEVERLLADCDDAKRAAAKSLRDDHSDEATAALGRTLGAITGLRAELDQTGDADLLSRLDDASAELDALQGSLESKLPVHSLKLMTDSLAATSRGRTSRSGRASQGSKGRIVRPSGDSGAADGYGHRPV